MVLSDVCNLVCLPNGGKVLARRLSVSDGTVVRSCYRQIVATLNRSIISASNMAFCNCLTRFSVRVLSFASQGASLPDDSSQWPPQTPRAHQVHYLDARAVRFPDVKVLLQAHKRPDLTFPTHQNFVLLFSHSLCVYITLLVLAALAAVFLKFYMTSQVPPLFMQLPRLEIAHRGFSSAAPENTVAAFKTALEKQVVSVEIDLMLSKDGVVVVAHDYNLESFTDSVGLINEMTWDELKNVRVTRGGKISSDFVKAGIDDKLARFEDILDAAARGQIQLVIELKSVPNKAFLIKRVAELLIEFDYVQNTLITSFFPGILIEFHRLCPEAYTLLLYSSKGFSTFCHVVSPPEVRSGFFWKTACQYSETFDWLASYLVEPIAKFSGAGAVGLNIDNPKLASLASRSLGWGLHVIVWTVNSLPQREIVAAIPGNERGVIGIMSDCPHHFCAAEA